MRTCAQRTAAAVAAALALASAAVLGAEPPAPGELRATFDPGARALTLFWASGPPIDELRLVVPPRLAERLRAVDFPEGWFLRREAGSLTLAGPAAAPPVRFRLELAEGAAPRTVAVEVRSGGHPVLAADEVPVGAAPPPASSVAGLLRLPPVVAPGEPVLVQVLDPARTPPAGTWRLAGAAAAPWDPRVSAFDPDAAHRIEIAAGWTGGAPAPRGQDLARLAAALAEEDGRGRSARYTIRPLAAAELEAGAAIEEEEFTVEELPIEVEGEEALEGQVEGEAAIVPEEVVAEEVAPPATAGEREARRGLEHAIAYSVVAVAAEPFGLAEEPGAAVFAIAPRRGAELLADSGPDDEGLRLYAVTGPTRSAGAPERVFAVAGAGAPGEKAGRLLAVVPARTGGGAPAFDVAPVEALPPPPAPEQLASLLTAVLPDDLAPGGALPVSYTDPTGETTVDARAAASVEIDPPGRRQGPPRLDAAGAHALAGAPLCVCGRFPSPRAWRGFTLDGQSITPAAASGWAAWLPLSPDLAPGRHTVAGATALGFAAGREISFEVVTVELALDDARLLAGEPAPLAVRVVGTAEPLTVRLHNRTPDRATLDGGDAQTVTSSGGEENIASVTVRPRRRGGAPEVGWEIAGAACPCVAEQPLR